MSGMTRMKIELPFRNSKQIHIFNPVSENVWAVHNIKCIYT